jgi:hypothetical protein
MAEKKQDSIRNREPGIKLDVNADIVVKRVGTPDLPTPSAQPVDRVFESGEPTLDFEARGTTPETTSIGRPP